MNDIHDKELSFKPSFHIQGEDSVWRLRRDIALSGSAGRSQIGIRLAFSEAQRIKDDGGKIQIEPEGEGASLARASIDMWEKE